MAHVNLKKGVSEHCKHEVHVCNMFGDAPLQLCSSHTRMLTNVFAATHRRRITCETQPPPYMRRHTNGSAPKDGLQTQLHHNQRHIMCTIVSNTIPTDPLGCILYRDINQWIRQITTFCLVLSILRRECVLERCKHEAHLGKCNASWSARVALRPSTLSYVVVRRNTM